MLSCEYCEIFKSTRFEQHLRTADSELGSRFENHTDSIILLKYQSLANQYFKHNLRSMPSLNFTPVLFLNLGFLCSPLTITIQRANVCSPWTLSYYYNNI